MWRKKVKRKRQATGSQRCKRSKREEVDNGESALGKTSRPCLTPSGTTHHIPDTTMDSFGYQYGAQLISANEEAVGEDLLLLDRGAEWLWPLWKRPRGLETEHEGASDCRDRTPQNKRKLPQLLILSRFFSIFTTWNKAPASSADFNQNPRPGTVKRRCIHCLLLHKSCRLLPLHLLAMRRQMMTINEHSLSQNTTSTSSISGNLNDDFTVSMY